jgi:5,5'-dehydrodivanillate O-demethylase
LILDRTREHLGVSDEGVILLRKLFKQCIDAVENGQDPVGVIRDPVKNQILSWVPGEYKVDPAEPRAASV